MRFRDIAVYPQERFSLGVEEDSGRYYVSIPVSSGMVDYDEYYVIDRATFEAFRADPERAGAFAERARDRELDGLLLVAPGADRGAAI